MRKIGVVTVARSDYGIYLPVLRAIQADPDLELELMVSGMHLSPEFGLTIEAILADGFVPSQKIEMLLASDTPQGIAKSLGLGIVGFSQAFAQTKPDILVVLGDRFEMYAAAIAALPFKIPIAHIHGGEVTVGAIDDALRHSMTKLSHLHFVSTQTYAQRVVQLGEEPWRVCVSGAPGLDHLHTLDFLDADALKKQFGLKFDTAPLLVTYHPVTLEYEKTEWQMQEFLSALRSCNLPIIFTGVNADTSGRTIMRLIEDFVSHHAQAQVVDTLGTLGYFSLMSLASAMVGNSSSGIIESPSFGLPVVNVGTRQEGRVRGPNVIDVGYDRQSIILGLNRALDPVFRNTLKSTQNPYGDGYASEKIVQRLKTIVIDERLFVKRFYDLAP